METTRGREESVLSRCEHVVDAVDVSMCWIRADELILVLDFEVMLHQHAVAGAWYLCVKAAAGGVWTRVTNEELVVIALPSFFPLVGLAGPPLWLVRACVWCSQSYFSN